ncbi:MAG: AMP-binding protein [Deltaproteobacteria bacterium]|nr:AMP-binding protein [Deltaproteobacteria bacterium]
MIPYMKINPTMARHFLDKGYWKPLIFADFFERNAKDCPKDEALVDGDTRLSWADLNLYAERAALKMVEMGIERDSVMIEQTQDCWEHVVMRLAAEKAGVVSLPVMRVLRHAEIEHLVRITRTKTILIPKTFRDFDYYQMLQDIKDNTPSLEHIFVVGDDIPEGTISVREIVKEPLEEKYPPHHLMDRRFKPEEIGTLTATTGTTGFPKVTQWVLAAQLTANEGHVKAWEMSKGDVCLSLAPLPGLGGTITYRCAPQVGAKIVLIEHYTPEKALELIEKERVTILALVPTQLSAILSHPDFEKHDLSSIRIVRPSGGVTAPSLIDEAESRLNCKVLISYGGTDYGSMTHMSIHSSDRARRFSVGKPLHNLQIKFLDDRGEEADEGVIVVKGPCTSDGYWENAEATREVWTKDGWGNTGDLGRFDEEGNLVILGRKKDMIIRGGQNIFPAEIERYLLSHPKIKDVAIVGMPDPQMGERACAFVVPKPGQTISFDDMVAFLRGKNLASYKLPERLEILDAMPLAGGQKIDKKALRRIIETKIEIEGKTS